jgi:hypothetical protein
VDWLPALRLCCYSGDTTQQATCRADATWHAIWSLLDVLQVLQNSGLDLSQLDVYEQQEFVPFDPTVKRTEATLKGPDGRVFKTTKGECCALQCKQTPQFGCGFEVVQLQQR